MISLKNVMYQSGCTMHLMKQFNLALPFHECGLRQNSMQVTVDNIDPIENDNFLYFLPQE